MNPAVTTDKPSARARTRGSKVLFFLAGGHRCGVPISRVVRILKFQEVTPLPRSADYVMGMFNLQGKILPVLDFALRLANKKFVAGDNSCIVILQAERDGKNLAFGVAVEEVMGVVDVLQEDIQDPPPGLDGVDTQLVRGILGQSEDLRIMIAVDSIGAPKDWEGKNQDGASAHPVK